MSLSWKDAPSVDAPANSGERSPPNGHHGVRLTPIVNMPPSLGWLGGQAEQSGHVQRQTATCLVARREPVGS